MQEYILSKKKKKTKTRILRDVFFVAVIWCKIKIHKQQKFNSKRIAMSGPLLSSLFSAFFYFLEN